VFEVMASPSLLDGAHDVNSCGPRSPFQIRSTSSMSGPAGITTMLSTDQRLSSGTADTRSSKLVVARGCTTLSSSAGDVPPVMLIAPATESQFTNHSAGSALGWNGKYWLAASTFLPLNCAAGFTRM